MIATLRFAIGLAGVSVLGAPSLGQSFNIDFGLPESGPPPTYGAAGQIGAWNSIEGEHTPFNDPQIIYDLVDLQGNPTGVTLHQFGGLELIAADDPSVDGNDAILLNDALVTHSANLETCLYIDGLETGTYEVLTYAWMPNHPETLSRVRHDFTPGPVDVGGAWTGEHVEGITYARHIVEVAGSFMGSHSGNVDGADLRIGAALNGIQLRRLDSCPGDLECTVGPDEFSAFRGFYVSGDLNSLLESDDSDLCYNPGIVLNPTEAPITLDFFGTVPNDSPASLDVTIESSANTVGLELTFSFWNYNTNSWDVVGTDTQSLNVDTVRTFAGIPADHVEPGTGEVRTRYEVRQAGIVFVFPWLDCVDQVFWTTSN